MHDDGVLYNIHYDELRINCLVGVSQSFKNEHCGHTEGKNDPSQVSAREMR